MSVDSRIVHDFKEDKPEYPKLMRFDNTKDFNSDYDFIVLFEDNKKGTIVWKNPAFKNAYRELGSQGLYDQSKFVAFYGEIILKGE